MKECPLCGASMRLKLTDVDVYVPGNPAPSKRTQKEWVCPDCDYYEEADEEEKA